ncbi:MAG: hypothetical protein KF901_27900 [Myxococcales bacterium]|nr:hypothetical protein [Myxococcales bacterium]
MSHASKPLALALALALVALSAASADAQRRRRPRQPPAEAPTEAPADSDDEDADPAAAPPAQTTAQTAQAAPAEVPEPPPPAEESAPLDDPSALPDLEPLRAELATLMDELVQARSRVAVLGRQLFQTKVRVRVDNRSRGQVLRNLVLRLDGDPIHRTESDPGRDGAPLFEGFAAPGPHDLTVEVEQRSRDNEAYRSIQRDQFRFEVTQGKLTDIVIRLDDRSDIEGDGGEYDVRMRIRVRTRDLESER